MAVQIQNAYCGHNFENTVGAKRDPIAGEVSYAVIWSDNNYKSGGSWEPAGNFDLLQDFDTDLGVSAEKHCFLRREGVCEGVCAEELEARAVQVQSVMTVEILLCTDLVRVRP